MELSEEQNALEDHGPAAPQGALTPVPDSSTRCLLKTSVQKCLSQRRLDVLAASGQLRPDDRALQYMQQLDEHRRKCELMGRYAEAGVAAGRIADLKAAQATRLRAELVALQQAELEQLQATYQQETLEFDQQWRAQVTAFEANAAAQFAAHKQGQQQQLTQFAAAWESRRPAKPQLSAQYLNHRKIEEMLVKQGAYRKAHEVKLAADALYVTELDSTYEQWSAEQEIKKTQLLTKQQVELEVLLQRAARARNELELRRLDQLEKRHNRFRCMLQELDSMHRLEVVHLENYLDGQARAGKYVPLRDSTSRRKRELLGL